MVQEEAQQQNIQSAQKTETEASALLGKGEQIETKCKHCGYSNHLSEQCWFGPGNMKPRRGGFNGQHRGQRGYRTARGGNRGRCRSFQNQGGTYQSGNNYQNGNNYQSGNGYNGNGGYRRMAENVQAEASSADLVAALAATSKQLENFMKLVPKNASTSRSGHDTDEELECNFAGLHYT
ncbi:uncharacterized protein LOC141633794 [Silene latifolia]|uniref:uncharacterized protein LOC141633794 n=1 Tax=Silene latifolia TaxID=37657 RepID=UPI003D76A461